MTMLEAVNELMSRGGVVMWPLLGLSVIAVTLAFERTWFFLRNNHPGQLAKVTRMGAMLRTRDDGAARTLAEGDNTVYGTVVKRLLGDEKLSEPLAVDAVESQRRRLERFMPILSTIITAAPMLGILGTVLGIISSFEVLSEQTAAAGGADPRNVSLGIAEALITTAAGLVVSLITLFPYNAFRAQIERTLTRLESLANSALQNR